MSGDGQEAVTKEASRREVWMREFLLFALFGLMTAAIYFIALSLLLEIVEMDYRIAVSVSYLVGVLFHFVANRTATFKQRGMSGAPHQFAKYLVVVVINYVLTLAVVTLAVEWLSLAPYVGVVLSMGATVVAGFFLTRFWVFKGSSS